MTKITVQPNATLSDVTVTNENNWTEVRKGDICVRFHGMNGDKWGVAVNTVPVPVARPNIEAEAILNLDHLYQMLVQQATNVVNSDRAVLLQLTKTVLRKRAHHLSGQATHLLDLVDRVEKVQADPNHSPGLLRDNILVAMGS